MPSSSSWDREYAAHIEARGRRMPGLDAYIEQTKAKIAAHGHAVQYVFAGHDVAGFHYTVGRTAKGRPEIVVIGLPQDVGTIVCNEIARRDDLTPLKHGDVLDDVVEGYPVALVQVTDEKYWPLNIVRAVYGIEDVDALQVVYPDFQCRFPWMHGYDIGHIQSVLQ